MITIPVKSPRECAKIIREIAARYPKEMGDAMFQRVSYIMRLSQEQVPVGETGNLKASGHVEDPVISDGSITVEFGYSMDYAFWVHEVLDVWHLPPTKAKYLEDPVSENLDNLAEDVLTTVNKMLRRY